MVFVRTQNFLSPAARGSCTLVVVRVVVVRSQNFLTPDARVSGTRGSGTNAKFSSLQPRVVLIRTQNFLRSAARGCVTHGSSARGSCTKSKFSNSSRAC